MKKSILGIATVLAMASLLLQPVEVLAHHSFAAEFDANLKGKFTGVVTEVRFSNPHVRYRMDVKTADGKTESWEIQAGSVTSIRPQGWLADTIKVGDTITVEGQLGRDKVKKVYVRQVTLANGKPLMGTEGNNTGTANAPATPRPDPNAVNADPKVNYAYGQHNAAFPFDISGPWLQRYKFHVTVDDLEPKPTPYTAEGRKLRDANTKYEDPALRCISLGLPRIFGNPYNMEIYDAGSHYLFMYVEHNTRRKIWMDGRKVPAETVPTSNGYSVGHWEGPTLVIETTNLMPGWLDGSGMPMSGKGTRTVERYTFAADHLAADRTMTIYDPLYTQPLVRTRGLARGPNIDVSEQDSCDPNSYFGDLLESGLLEKHLKP